jgi:hypothetical protein
MSAADYRERARLCRLEASRAWGHLQVNFLAAAKTWDSLADRLERMDAAGVVHTDEAKKRLS